MGTGKYLEASTNRTLVQNDLNESTSNMWLAAELAQQLRAAGAKVYLLENMNILLLMHQVLALWIGLE